MASVILLFDVSRKRKMIKESRMNYEN